MKECGETINSTPSGHWGGTAAVLYWWRAVRRRTWRPTVVVILLCGILGAVALGALAGARRTESAYGRYLSSINSSDVLVNVPLPGTSGITKVSALPGIRSSAAWLGLNANPVVHGRVDDAFLTDALDGTYHGAFFTQDTMTVLRGRLPRLDTTDEIALTPDIARLFGVGLGGTVTYQYLHHRLIGCDEVGITVPGSSSYSWVQETPSKR